MSERHILTVWRKEIFDTIRDRRTLIAGILAPVVIMPLLSLGSQALMTNNQQKALAERTPIAILGAAEAPRLVSILRASGAFKELSPADPARALKDGSIKLLVRIPPGFEREAFTGSRPAKLTVEYEAREMTAAVALGKIRERVEAYLAMAQAARLGLRDPSVLRAVAIEERNTSTPREMGGMLLSFFLPFALAIWGIMGGMYTAIDAVAGEKERRTLETLVVTPPARASLAAGKILAVLTMSTLTIVLSLASTYLSFRFGLPLVDRAGDFHLGLDLGTMGLLLAVAFPYLAMLAGLQIALSSFGKSFKETQNYFSALMFAVMLPGMALAIMDRHFPVWLYAMPFVNAVALFKDIFTDSWHWRDIAISTVVNMVYCAGALLLAQRMLADEKLMFKS